jgi:Zinc knuckle
MDLRSALLKGSEDIDTFIARLDELAAQAGNAISDPLHRLDSVDINSAFPNTLDTLTFLAKIGEKYITANPRQTYTDIRIYYSSHFVHKLSEQATIAAIAAAAAASVKPIAIDLDEDSPRMLAIDNRDNRTTHTRADTDEDVECHPGNIPQTAMDTVPSTKGQVTQQNNVEHVCNLQRLTFKCYNCNKFGHKSPDCPQCNRCVPSSLPTPMSMPISAPSPREPPVQPQAPRWIYMIQTPMSAISVHPSEEQPRTCMVRAGTLGISTHPFEEST